MDPVLKEWLEALLPWVTIVIALLVALYAIRTRFHRAERQAKVDAERREIEYAERRMTLAERQKGLDERDVALAVRQRDLDLAQGTLAEEIADEKAVLAHQTAETNKKAAEVAAALALFNDEDVVAARKAAELRMLEARTAAEEEQAAEHIREEHKLKLALEEKAAERDTDDKARQPDDVVDRYVRLRTVYKGSGEYPPRPRQFPRIPPALQPALTSCTSTSWWSGAALGRSAPSTPNILLKFYYDGII